MVVFVGLTGGKEGDREVPLRKLTRLLAVLVLLLGFSPLPSLSRAQNSGFTDSFMLDKCDFASRGRNPFFILEPGYKLVLEGKEGKEFLRLEITVLNERKTITGVETRVVEEVETKDGRLVEISRNYFAICKPNNSVVYFGEEVDIYEGGVVVSHDGAWQAGKDDAKPGLIMPGVVLLGARYFQEIAPDVAMDRAEILSISEVVKTPAGTFEDVLKTEETTPLEPNAKGLKFYAPGIGLIQDSTVKLVWFSPGF